MQIDVGVAASVSKYAYMYHQITQNYTTPALIVLPRVVPAVVAFGTVVGVVGERATHPQIYITEN